MSTARRTLLTQLGAGLAGLWLALPAPAAADEPRGDSTRGGPRPDGRVAGYATYYDASLHGDLMANGEPYDQWDPSTAASNTYPLGTQVKVTRVATGESIVVRITDRGAFHAPLLIDLSFAAFHRLADPDDGRIRVIVEPLD